MSSLTVTPLSTALGAQISGVDITQPLSPEQRDAIEQALLTHSVVFFRDQPLTPQQQARFAANFGDLHIHPIYPNVPEQPEVLILDTAVTDVRDNAVWHTDVTFLPTPALGAVLSAKQLPAFGGDTLWASGIAAYAALSEPLKRLLDGLTATHDFTKSFPLERFGNTAENLARWEETRKKNPPLSHPPGEWAQVAVCQRGLHHQNQRAGSGGERGDLEAAVRPRDTPGVHDSLALAGE